MLERVLAAKLDSTSGMATEIIALGGRLILAGRDWLTTTVVDAPGRVTMLVHVYMRHIAAVVNPLGQRTSVAWYGRRPATNASLETVVMLL